MQKTRFSKPFKSKQFWNFVEGLETRYRTNGFWNFYKKSLKGSAEVSIEGSPIKSPAFKKYLERDWQRQFKSNPSPGLIDHVVKVLDAIFWADRESLFWCKFTAIVLKESACQLDKDSAQVVKRLVRHCRAYIIYIDGDGNQFTEELANQIPSSANRNDLRSWYKKQYGILPAKETVALAEKIITETSEKNASNYFWKVKVEWAKKHFGGGEMCNEKKA